MPNKGKETKAEMLTLQESKDTVSIVGIYDGKQTKKRKPLATAYRDLLVYITSSIYNVFLKF